LYHISGSKVWYLLMRNLFHGVYDLFCYIFLFIFWHRLSSMIFSFFIILLFYWEHLWLTFTKVLTIYHSWIQSLHHSPLFSCPHSWNSFSMSHLCIFIHEYIIFPLYSLLSPFLYVISVPTGTNPQTGTVLPSCSPFLKRGFLFV
jgi:hypothetical protein